MAWALHDKLGDSIRQQKSQWDGTVMHNNQDGHPASAWPIATYQGILLYLVLALQRSRQRLLNQLDYDILVTLVTTCRRHNLFFYPRMVARYQDINSVACIWVGVEEIKRFGIALYRVCKLCSNGNSSNVDECGRFKHDLLTLPDLQFPMPESDELWNAESNIALSNRLADINPNAALDGRRQKNWISNLGELCSDCLMI
ncbi:hypothetical protein PHISCL_03023 [Aspergillus sclerotialis]|uniref:Uncharacterized protein n=1 Tax=Aspergillus sclerotialis TaxID=2070753 RepID=A0A3A2ZTC9_9EURO|nr:hypothetical protein PHISCL_03023 [Aspergillus sclerotialis]